MVFFSTLNIFKITVVKSLLCKSVSGLPQGYILLAAIFPVCGLYFVFVECVLIFVNWQFK